MNPRIRLYDLITVLGVLVVLVWTPVYMAEGGGPDAPPAGHKFLPPDVRYGDRIAYELIVQIEGEPAVSTGPFVTLSFRAPDDEQEPNGTVLVVEQDYPALHIDLGPVILQQNEHHIVHYFNSAGNPLGGTTTGHRIVESGSTTGPTPAIEHNERATRDGLFMWTLPVRHHPVVYQPEANWQAFLDLIKGESGPRYVHGEEQPAEEPAVHPAPTDERKEETTPLIAVHRDRVLYATDILTLPADKSLEDGPGLFFGFRLLMTQLDWREGETYSGARHRWNWWAEALPVRAGEHWSIYESDHEDARRLATFDLVPADYDPGDTPVPLDGPGHRPTERQPNPENPSFEDTTPIVDGHSLSGLHADLSGEHAPEGVREIMRDGAGFAGIVWENEPTGTTFLLSMLLENTTHAAYVFYGDGDVEIENACGKTYNISGEEIGPVCQTYPLVISPRTTDLGVRPPGELLPALRDHLRRQNGPWEHEFGMYRFDLTTPIPPGEGQGNRRVNPIHGALPLDQGGQAIVGHRSQDGVFTASGSIYFTNMDYRGIRYQDGTQGIGSQQPVKTASTTTAPQMISPFGPEPIYGGIALLLLGILLRLAAAVKTGAHLPLFGFFYAKIARDNALDHRYRETIAELVSAEPGIQLTEVAKRTGLSRTGAYHHLETLVRNRLLHITVVARARHYFPSDWKDPNARLRQAVSRRDGWQKVMDAVEAHPGAPLHALVERLDVGKSTVSRTGSRLASLGLVRKVREGREIRFYPADIDTPPQTPTHAPTVEA